MAPQYVYPDADVDNGGAWTTAPLYAKIDEEPYDDGDYVISPKTAANKSFTVGLGNPVDFGIHTDHTLRIRAKATLAGATLKFELLQGTTVIHDSGNQTLGVAFEEFNFTLSEGEAAEITDYTALRVRVTAVTTGNNKYQWVSWIRFEIPGETIEEHSGSVSISGVGGISGAASKGAKASLLVTGLGILLALGITARAGPATISGVGTITVYGEKAATEQREGSVSISGIGGIAAHGSRASPGSVITPGIGRAEPLGAKGGQSGPSVAGVSEVDAYGQKGAAGAALLSGVGTLEATGRKEAKAAPITIALAFAQIEGVGIESGEENYEGAVEIVGIGALSIEGAKAKSVIGARQAAQGIARQAARGTTRAAARGVRRTN